MTNVSKIKDGTRDCENCQHHVMTIRVGDGNPPQHIWGCESWNCEFEPREEVEDGNND